MIGALNDGLELTESESPEISSGGNPAEASLGVSTGDSTTEMMPEPAAVALTLRVE